MIVDDVCALAASPLVVAEGSTVPAWAAQEACGAVWLIPTQDFQCARLEERGLPQAALDAYLLLAERIERDAAAHGVPVFTIDGSRGVEEVVEEAELQFAAALAAGPKASGLSERQALLREANESVVSQLRAYYAALDRW
jgi:hypothetical protein